MDDEARNLDVLESILTSPELKLVRAQSASTALLTLINGDFACIVMDIHMPDMSGIDLARLIKTRKRCEHIPIIFLTAYFQDEKDVLNGYDVGAVDYLTKPFNPEILKSKVGVFVNLYQANHALAASNVALEKEIIHRQQAEAALREANQALEARVEKRTSDLSLTNAELRLSEERYRLILENALEYAIFTINREGLVTTWNAGAQRILGYTENEIVGRKLDLIFTAEDRARGQLELEMGGALANDRAKDERWHLRKDGSPFWAAGMMMPLKDDQGRHLGFLKILRDRTARKRSEEALKESEERFRSMANAAPVLIWMSGTDKHRFYFNQPWLDFTGRKLEDEMGEGWTKGVHPDDLPRYLRIYHGAFDRREPFKLEYRLRRADGQYRWLQAHGVPRHTADGTFLGYIAGCLDITERREAEETIRRANEMLEARVQERTADLARANITLHGQIHEREHLEALVLSISEREQQRIGQDLHDGLCQHLTGVKFRAKLLEEKLAKRSLPEKADATTIESLVSEAIDQARSQAHGLYPVRLTSDGLKAALVELTSHISNVFRVECTLSADDAAPIRNQGPAIHLYRIAQEAISNAIRHGQAKKIELSLVERKDEIELRIEDNGSGIPAKPRKASGTGLHIMQYRAHSIGGKLEIKNRPQGGVLVSCVLPAYDATPPDDIIPGWQPKEEKSDER